MTIPEIFKILYFTSIIVWLIPPIRQFRGNLFWYFLILAVSDPISLVLKSFSLDNISPIIFMGISFLLIVSLLGKENLRKYRILLVSILLLILFVSSFQFDYKFYFTFIILINFFIFFIFLKEFIVRYVSASHISVFYIFLLLYMLTVILKFFNMLMSFADATAFFFLTSIAQIIFGLYFSIFREDKPGPAV